ncbi:hypothetical protein BHM03_00041978 [Ensete ventricosum]|nr:hypothetical protein BHM03_00041978 [Ensete ventricosum]
MDPHDTWIHPRYENVLQGKVCNFNLYRPVPGSTYRSARYRYADRPLPGSTIKNRPSMVDFSRRWPIEGEIDCWRSISTVGSRLKEKSTVGGRLRKKKERRRRGKEEKKKRRRKNTVPSSPACRCRPRVARTRERFFSRTRRQNVSPRGEKDRGDYHTSIGNMSVHRYGPVSQTLLLGDLSTYYYLYHGSKKY